VHISFYNGKELYVPMHMWKLLELVILTPEYIMTDTVDWCTYANTEVDRLSSMFLLVQVGSSTVYTLAYFDCHLILFHIYTTEKLQTE